MYTVTQKHTKGVTGGKYYISIYYINAGQCINVTREVAKRFDLTIKKGKIVFIHGCGTGFSRISEIMKEEPMYLLD